MRRLICALLASSVSLSLAEQFKTVKGTKLEQSVSKAPVNRSLRLEKNNPKLAGTIPASVEYRSRRQLITGTERSYYLNRSDLMNPGAWIF